MEACVQLNPHLLSMDMVKDQLNLAIIIGLCAQLKPRLVNMDIGKDQLNLALDMEVITDLCGQLMDMVGPAMESLASKNSVF